MGESQPGRGQQVRASLGEGSYPALGLCAFSKLVLFKQESFVRWCCYSSLKHKCSQKGQAVFLLPDWWSLPPTVGFAKDWFKGADLFKREISECFISMKFKSRRSYIVCFHFCEMLNRRINLYRSWVGWGRLVGIDSTINWGLELPLERQNTLKLDCAEGFTIKTHS